MMEAILWGAVLAMLMPAVAEAASLRYADKEGDWIIMGMRSGGGSSSACAMKSERESNHDFLYLVSMGQGPVKVSVSVTTTLNSGPVSATFVPDGGSSIALKGSVSSKGLATLEVRDNQTRAVRDAMASEKPGKLTLSRQGTPPQVIDVSFADASDGLDSLGACARKMLGVDD